MRILLSGAHLTPALAMIDFIKLNHPEHELFFVGRLYSQEKLGQKAIEQDEVSKRKVKFISFTAAKFANYSYLSRLLAFLIFPKTVAMARKILIEEKIDVFLSFGSYLAVPFALAAKSLGIPVVTHEQTVVVGKANKFIANLADRVAISYEESKNYLTRKDLVVTGNPVRAKLFAKDLKRPKWLPTTAQNLLLVMGGNQGSFAINDLVKENLTALLGQYCVIHQCGRANKIKDSFQELTLVKQKLAKPLQNKYFIKEWIEEEDLFWIYQHAKFAISRSGANAVLELSLAPLPAILIPLEKTYQNEQLANALLMQKINGALILQQSKLNSTTFLDSVAYLEKNYKKMRLDLAKNQLYQDACSKLYHLLVDVYQKNNKKMG